MKHVLIKNLTALVALVVSSSVFAQEQIAIDEADLKRMGIIFSPVEPLNSNFGMRFPATVINSPDSASVISSRYSGTVSRWLANAGDQLQAGDTILEIQSSELIELQNAWVNADAELLRANFELTKDRALFEQGVISQQRLNNTSTAQRQALFAEQALRTSLELAGFDSQKMTALKSNGEFIGSYFVESPTTAVLTQRGVGVGEYVDSNVSLAQLDSSSKRWISAHVPARIAAGVQVGQRITLVGSGDALTVRQKDLTVDTRDQSVELYAEFDADTSMTTGQVVSVIIPPSEAGFLIPDSAVVHSGNQTSVYVRSSQGVEARVLQLQAMGAAYFALEGISSSDQIVIQGSAILKGMQLGLGGGE
ncbi:MAG: efflux RND transporter periplasmic adaptor subunit [Pseudohongiellaceae bacterium]|nr:efflux RND transporter periplasmic adaptor subunit [Pseudohongiellaceae bacterium]